MADLRTLLKKIATQKPLTSPEMASLERIAAETQQTNAQVSGIIGSDGKPYFPSGFVSNGDIQIGKAIIGVDGARVKRVGSQTIPHNTFTSVNFDTIEYNDGTYIDLSVDDTKITILTAGIYKIFFGVQWETGLTTTFGAANIWVNGSSKFPASRLPSIGNLINTAYDERLYLPGDYLQLRMLQFTGGDRDIVSSFMAVSKVRSNV